MLVADGDPEAIAEAMGIEIEDVELETPLAPKVLKRKTQADRNKAKRRIEEVSKVYQELTISTFR
jgi:hypothetical protein